MRKLILQIVGGIAIAFIVFLLGINKESLKYTIMGDNYEGPYVINNINYIEEINVFDVSATHLASGVTVEVATSDTLKLLPPEVRYPIEYYLKSKNLSEKDLKKRTEK